MKNIKYLSYSDEELMQFIANGKEGAFDEIYNRYAKKIFHFLCSKLNNDSEKANDLLQDLFLKIIEQPKSFDTKKKFSSWIFTVAYNQCINEHRRNKVRGLKVNDFEMNTVIDPDSSTMKEENRFTPFMNKLTQELNKLNPKHSTVFELRYTQNMSINEISEVMECSKGTVKSRLYNATKKLATLLQDFNRKPIKK